MLGRLNEVLARRAVNIAAQYYETDGEIGYVVLDADASAADGQRSSPTSGRWKAPSAHGCSTNTRSASLALRCLPHRLRHTIISVRHSHSTGPYR